MNEQPEITREDPAATADAAGAAPSASPGDEAPTDEFQLTVRKLEMPVRPRGVLAE